LIKNALFERILCTIKKVENLFILLKTVPTVHKMLTICSKNEVLEGVDENLRRGSQKLKILTKAEIKPSFALSGLVPDTLKPKTPLSRGRWLSKTKNPARFLVAQW